MPNGRLQAKVGDFGLSRQIYSPSSSPEAGRHPPRTPHPGLASPPPVDACSVPSWCSLTSGVGTAIYAAPEQLTGSAYSQKVRARSRLRMSICSLTSLICACIEVECAAACVCLQSDVYSLGLIMFELYNVFTTEMERRHCLYQARKGNIPDSFKQQWRLQVGAN